MRNSKIWRFRIVELPFVPKSPIDNLERLVTQSTKLPIAGIILIILIAFASILNFIPRVNYAYPLHVDEYVHFQYANHLSNNAPEYFGGNKITLENGFHVLLATLNSLGISYLMIFRFLPILFTAILCLCVFITIAGDTSRIFLSENK